MKVHIITLFPDMFTALDHGVIGRAQSKQLMELTYHNPRDFTHDVHHTVDDRPYGGGPGMVMKYEPLHAAIQQAKAAATRAKVIQLSPAGKVFDQEAAKHMSKETSLILVAGRYEGIDERLIEDDIDEQWSVGDYVVSGGELPAMLMIDAITRLLPGVLGSDQSAKQDSFSEGLLDCPHYTRPEEINGKLVPKMLQSGNHKAIERWRLKQSLGRTWQRRPDLIKRRVLTPEEQILLDEYMNEC